MMFEYKGMNQILHFIIGVCLLLISLFIYIGLRPIFILASLALAIFLIDYSIFPFIYIYQAFIQWLPILFELNILNGILISTRIFHFSKFWSSIFICISILRSLTVIYCHYLPTNDYHRLYIENKIQILTNLFFEQLKTSSNRLIQLFNQNDEKDLEKFQLEQINSNENDINEHDETIHRFQQIAHELASPIVSSIDCSNSSTPPVRRHHERILQQSELEPLSRTPITPAHTNSSKGKILHSTINGSYTGPMTRNRKKTGGSTSITTSPLKSKMMQNEMTFLICKRDEDIQIQRS